MGELIVKDDRELRRLDEAIAAFEARPAAERLRMQGLLSALLATRNALAGPKQARHRRPLVARAA